MDLDNQMELLLAVLDRQFKVKNLHHLRRKLTALLYAQA